MKKIITISAEARLCRQVSWPKSFLQTRMKPSWHSRKPSMAFKGLQKAFRPTHLLSDLPRTLGITKKNKAGFTLIEVLLALSVIAIALTALLKSTAQSVNYTQRIKEKSLSHWVAMQAVTAIQLGMIPMSSGQELTHQTSLLGDKWYWRATLSSTSLKSMKKISVTVSHEPIGPFRDPLIAYQYKP